MTGQHRIVVLGAGYAGLAAARRLARRAKGTQITVVDARSYFVERVRLHQLAAGQQVPRWELRQRLESKGIRFVRGRATTLDPAAKRITLADDTTVDYDTLVYTLGSVADTESVAGVRQYAHTVATVEDVARLDMPAGRVAIVGGGSTGIETAAELAESRPDLTVSLVSSEEPGAWLSERAQRYILTTLERLGVTVHSGAKVIEVTPNGLHFADGGGLDAETVLWTTGFTVPDLAARAGLAVDAHGRLLVDETMRTSDPDIYAAGDCAAISGPGNRELRMACATALPTGAHAADSVCAHLNGRRPSALEFRYHLQCISMGRRDGVIQFLRSDDTPTERVLTGRTAARVKEIIVRGAALSARP